jgi:hypothetical protein
MKYYSTFSIHKNVELERILSSERPERFIDTHCGIGWNFYGVENIPQEGSLRIGGRYSGIVVGLDVNKTHILRARMNTRDLSNIHLVCADANYPPLQDQFISHSFVNADPSNISEMICCETLQHYCSLADQVTLTLPKIEWGPFSREILAKAYAKKGLCVKNDRNLLFGLRIEMQKIGKKVRRIRGETRDHFRVSIR